MYRWKTLLTRLVWKILCREQYRKKTYHMDEEVRIMMHIPETLLRPDRKYRMICVSENGEVFIYEDLDENPDTITILTDNFYAYALVYKNTD